MLNQKEYHKKYYIDNKDKFLEYREKNKVRIEKYNKKYYKENKEYFSAKRKERYEKNKEDELKKNKKWKKDNIEDIKKYGKKYRSENREYHLERLRKWQRENKKHILEYNKKNEKHRNKINRQWREKNKEYYKKYHKEYHKKNPECRKQYYKDNINKIREYCKIWQKNRKRTNLKHNLTCKMRLAIWHSLKGNKKGRHWENLVGYTLKDLIRRLKRTMPKGYTWKDFMEGKLHIDHIIPIKVFNFTKSEHIGFKRCWALKNLQLLLAKENNIKRAKLDKPFQSALQLNSYEIF